MAAWSPSVETPSDAAQARAEDRPEGRRPPSSNTGVVSTDRRVSPGVSETEDGLYGWDWSATTHAAREGAVGDLMTSLEARVAVPGRGLQGWSQSVRAFDGEGYCTGAVYFGGRDDVHVISTSAAADRARRSVVRRDPSARTSRVDTRVDTLVPWDDLRGVCEDVAGQKARITYMESSLRGESLGRTLYVGAPTSAVRVRVYEKWLESPGQYLEGTNRVEVQLRPPSRAKSMVTAWGPAETFCASELTRRLASQLGTDVARPGTLQKARATPDLERTLESMGEQYGPAVERWLAVSGGDVDTVLTHLLRAAS